MICFFDCDTQEQSAFETAVRMRGVRAQFFAGAPDVSAVPYGALVSVSHRFPVGAEQLRALAERGVSYLNTRSIGVNHIDTEAADALGICVEHVAYSPESVAEHAIMLMLMACRQIVPTLKRAQTCDYRLPELRAGTIAGSTVGVIGTGRIGRCVIERLRAFGCRVLAYDPQPLARARYVPLDTLLLKSDIVTLHAPLTDATVHLLDRARIGMMRPGAILVNVARGALVDTDALAFALEQGRLAGAALDVVEGEDDWFYRDCRDRGDAPFARLTALSNVVLTPHTAFYTDAALCDIVENTLNNCMEYERTRERWIV